ncbi:OmpA family protein [Serratia microhaemolytica]|uniref:OmpA family protein n=1 Tax=Serratia microhaemolytica TaxID=2675110 RepID=UPI000FDE6C53|nr:OmpA family protein [Serratia microhaemolytica]
MKQKWQWVLWLWGGSLSAILCWFFLPLSPGERAALLLLVLLISLCGIWSTARKPHSVAAQQLFNRLPPENYRLPIVLVCGDELASWFGEERIQQHSQGCWLRVEEINQLNNSAQLLIEHHPDWLQQLSVMVTINPQHHHNQRTLASLLCELRWQLVQLRQQTQCDVPLLLSSRIETALASSPIWLSQHAETSLTLWPNMDTPQTLSQWQTTGDSEQQALRIRQAILLHSQYDWLQAHVLPALQQQDDGFTGLTPQQILLQQVAPYQQNSENSLWQQWLSAQTALTTQRILGEHRQQTGNRLLPLPDFVLSALPRGSGISSRQRVLCFGINMLAITVMLALCSSGWQNQQLLQRIAFTLHHYQQVDKQNTVLTTSALNMLHDEIALLDDQVREGEPLQLGLGLYQGKPLLHQLVKTIKNYRQPIQAPQTVRLDSLSLFDTGKPVLKLNSSKVLIEALIDIKTKPGWLIVISGHTDNTGNRQKNEQLSLERAHAVRDWLVENSDLSPACFAVQGYGESHPIASNDTSQGRAANRRVDITLIPQTDDCQQQRLPQEIDR